MLDTMATRTTSVALDALRTLPVGRPVEDADLGIRGVPELCVIVPTFNERGNVVELVDRLRDALTAYRWEPIFVEDDSPDETARCVRKIAQSDDRVRCLQRIGRRGLASGCIEGMLASSAPYMAVIDGDLEHDETLLPRMLKELEQGEADIVIGTRYAHGGGLGDWGTGGLG